MSNPFGGWDKNCISLPDRQVSPSAFAAGQAKCRGELFGFAMSVLFFKRFLKRPWQIASIVPSSQALVERVASKIDFKRARVIAEYGPGEGVHSRALAQRMRPDAQLLLFELDPAFSRDLARQFAGDRRVRVINANDMTIRSELIQRGIVQCDYIISGIPFSILEKEKKTQPASANTRGPRARWRFHYLSGNKRAAPTRHRFCQRRVRIFSAKHSADVHHRFPQSRCR